MSCNTNVRFGRDRHSANTLLSISCLGWSRLAGVGRRARDERLATLFGERLRQLRNERGLSQEQLAEASGVHRTYVGHVERGESSPTLYSIVRFASGLGVDPGRLVEGMTP